MPPAVVGPRSRPILAKNRSSGDIWQFQFLNYIKVLIGLTEVRNFSPATLMINLCTKNDHLREISQSNERVILNAQMAVSCNPDDKTSF